MARSLRSVLLTLLSGTLILVVFSATVLAQSTDKSLTISPLNSEYRIDPGEVRTGKLIVRNSGENAYEFKVYAEVFKVKGEDYDQEFTPSDSLNAGSWIKFSQQKYTVNSGEAVNVGFDIIPPLSASPGGYYVAVFAETINQPTEGINTGARAGSLLYIEVAGKLNKSGNIASFEIPTWLKQTPFVATLKLTNEGNTHYRARGNVFYKDIFGRTIYSQGINGLVLPGTTRKFSVAYSPNIILPGFYQVGGDIDIFDQSVNLPTRWVLVMPPLYLVMFLGLGILIAVALYSFFHRLHSK